MGNVIQVTFDPTKWANGAAGSGTTAGCNGYDAQSVFVDKDNTTGWAFEYNGNGFARFNLSDGSIVHQDALMGNPGYNNWFTPMYQGNTIFFQDGAGHYFLGYSDDKLYKFHITSGGTSGTILNGYEVVDGSFDLSTLTGSFGLADMCIFQNGGTNYIGAISAFNSYLYVINADTMALVGYYQTIDTSASGFQVFADVNNVLWGMFNYGANYDNFFVKWDPANGATSGVLNSVTETTVTQASLGMRYNAQNCCYIPATHSVMMCSNTGTDTGDTVVIDMSTFDAPTPATLTTQGLTFSALGGQNGVTVRFVNSGAPDGYFAGGELSSFAAIVVNWNNDFTGNDITLYTLQDDFSTPRTASDFVTLFSTYNVYCTATGMNPIVVTGSGSTQLAAADPLPLTGGTPVHYDDLTFVQNNTYNTPLAAFDQGVQSGTLMFEGASGLPESNGGILQVVDPSTLTIINKYDVTSMINDDAALTPLTLASSGGQYCLVLAVQEFSSSDVVFVGINNIGSESQSAETLAFFNMIGAASWMNGHNYISVTSSFLTKYFFRASDSSAHGSFGPQDVVTGNSKVAVANGTYQMYSPMAGLAWNKTSNRALATYFNSYLNSSCGSPVYIVNTAAPQGSQVAVMATPNPAGGPTVPVTLTATVTGSVSSFPTSGMVTFYDGVTSLGSASVNGSGIATLSGLFFSLGSHSITAYFSGGN